MAVVGRNMAYLHTSCIGYVPSAHSAFTLVAPYCHPLHFPRGPSLATGGCSASSWKCQGVKALGELPSKYMTDGIKG